MTKLPTPGDSRAAVEKFGGHTRNGLVRAFGFVDGQVQVEFLADGEVVGSVMTTIALWRDWANVILAVCAQAETAIENGAGQTRQ